MDSVIPFQSRKTNCTLEENNLLFKQVFFTHMCTHTQSYKISMDVLCIGCMCPVFIVGCLVDLILQNQAGNGFLWGGGEIRQHSYQGPKN